MKNNGRRRPVDAKYLKIYDTCKFGCVPSLAGSAIYVTTQAIEARLVGRDISLRCYSLYVNAKIDDSESYLWRKCARPSSQAGNKSVFICVCT